MVTVYEPKSKRTICVYPWIKGKSKVSCIRYQWKGIGEVKQIKIA